MNEKNQLSLLEQRLRSTRPRFSPRVDFTERVMDALPAHSESGSRRDTAGARIPLLRLVLGLAAAAAITFVLLQILPRQAFISDAPAVAVENSERPNTLKLPEISMAQVEALGAKLDEPLQTELKNVISDTRQAIQFVASNFIPEDQSR